MSKDFANRKSRAGTRKSTSRAPKPRTKSRKAPSRTRNQNQPRKKRPATAQFHGPSFSGGIALGAILVLAGAYLPDVFRDTVEKTLSLKRDQPREPVHFEFGARLRNAEVSADPDAYARDANPDMTSGMEYLIQAASFASMDDAESLRARLILIGLPVRTTAVQVANKPWYRVTVGPFPSQTNATRAMTQLHELNLDALLIKRMVP
jgi:cell division protein FtsN